MEKVKMDEKYALEELQFIKKVIEDSKRSIVYNGMDYIIWGVLVIVGMLITYTLAVTGMRFNFLWVWLILIPIGWGFSYYNKKNCIGKAPKTITTKAIGAVWLAAGICMTLIGFGGPVIGGMNGMFISPVLAIICGGGYFVAGTILNSKPTSYLSLGWWIGGIILFMVHSINQMLIMAALMFLFQTIPGIIVYRKYKREEQSRS
jgi:hypothetical protein